ncbi:MAG: sigma-54-dependent Fis family transcriptional regulator [Candidatus Omnitrophica bacterium]|nr:sigma-54-dependent Fis family transcriptional regulator [Candidatus Omnitrophota bacterium]
MERDRILVVDDDPLIRGSLYEMLRGRRYDVEMASDGAEALESLKRRTFQLVLADWKMPRVDGIGLLDHIKTNYPGVSVVIITGFGNIGSAVEAIRQGAFDYLTKPIQPEELEATIKRALATYPQPTEDGSTDPFIHIIGEHPRMKRLCETIKLIASSSATVLLEGESGTGKRLIAHAIHRADPKRRDQPFVEVSCGALPETLLESELFGHVRGAFTGAIRDKQGRFELADGGTILLDEIDTFSPALQVKLLRVLQERTFEQVGDTRTIRVDVRIIAATNRHLESLVMEGKFREDLYYRVNVIALRIPPLRDRATDIPLLVEHFLKRTCERVGKAIQSITEEAMQAFKAHHWPGNVRELENMIERTVILAPHDKIRLQDLPESMQSVSTSAPVTHVGAYHSSFPALDGAPANQAKPSGVNGTLKEAMQDPERDIILKALVDSHWNRSLAAKRLGIHRSTLYHKLRKLAIDPSQTHS